MKSAFDEDNNDLIRDKIIGLGERSISKSYFPELKRHISELEASNQALKVQVAEKEKAREQLRLNIEKLSSINDYLFEIENLKFQEIFPFLSTKMMDIFALRAVWVGTYDDKTSEMVMHHTSMTDDDNSQIIKLLGRQLISSRTKITPEQYHIIVSKSIVSFNSIKELSFGYIPELIGRAIEKLINLNWFVIVPLMHKDTLLGSIVFSGTSDVQIPDNDLITAFGRIASIAISRKKAEEALFESEEIRKKLLVTVPDLIVRTDLTGKIIYINDAKFGLLDGTNRKDFYGKNMLSFIAPEDYHRALKNTELMFERHLGLQEYSLQMDNHKTISCELNGDIIRDDTNTPIEMIFVIRDVTDRKHSEALRRDSEELYRLMNNNSPLGMHFYELTEENRLVFKGANPAANSILGIEHNQFIEKTIEEAFPGLITTEVPVRYKEAAKNGIQWNTEQVTYKDNHIEGAFEVKAFQTKKNNMVAIFSDITFRKKAEEAIIESELRLRAVFDASPYAIIISRLSDGILTSVNLAFEKQTGIPKETAIGKSLLDLGLVKHVDNYHKLLDNVTKYGRVDSIESEILLKDGRVLWILYSAVKITLGSEDLMVTVTIDITDRKKAEEEIRTLNSELEDRVIERTEELQIALDKLNESNHELNMLNEQIFSDSNKMRELNETLLKTQDELKANISAKDKFFSIIAHDLRGPFAGFLNLTDLMVKDTDELSLKDIKRMSSMVNNAASSIYKLIEDLLEWSRSQIGTMPFDPNPIELLHLSRNAEITLSEMAVSKGISIKQSVPEGLIVNCDSNMITTIFRNLITNGIKFTNEGGSIEIGISDNHYNIDESNNIVVFVKDDGIGIPKEMTNEIFRIDKSITTKGTNKETGTGLGLVICKEFIDKHKCDIWAESTFGKGTTIYFTLPVQ